MRETRTPRQLASNRHPGRDPGPSAPYREARTIPGGAAGEASVEQAEFDAAAAWLGHFQAGRIGLVKNFEAATFSIARPSC